MPNRNDQAALQKFFFDEIQKGEELLAAGQYEESVKHLTNAITISGQPQQLLQVFQQTLPPDVFKMLMSSLASAARSTTASTQVRIKSLEPCQDHMVSGYSHGNCRYRMYTLSHIMSSLSMPFEICHY